MPPKAGKPARKTPRKPARTPARTTARKPASTPARTTARTPPRKPAKRSAPKRASAKPPAKAGAKAGANAGAKKGGTTPSDHAIVDAWIAAVIPERRAAIKRIDRILRDEIPDVVRTTKFRKPSGPLGTPFYGRPGHGWIAMLHSLKNAIRITFFAGAKLLPPLPVAVNATTSHVDLARPEDLDEAQLRDWARQAADLQGWAKV